MCNFCYKILGPTTFHKESECALKQSAICPLCGPGKHFLNNCPIKTKRVSSTQEVIPSVSRSENPPSILLSNSNSGYIEYIKLHKLEIQSTNTKNRLLVESHLQQRGYVVVYPPSTPHMYYMIPLTN
jgi:hypothetical protein